MDLLEKYVLLNDVYLQLTQRRDVKLKIKKKPKKNKNTEISFLFQMKTSFCK